MARRAKSSPKQRPATTDAEPLSMPEAQAVEMPRRGRKAKPKPETAVNDVVLPGVEETEASDADSASLLPAKPRRGRKPKPKADPDATEFSGDTGQADMRVDSSDTPAEEPRGTADLAAAAPTHSPAVSWDAGSGAATFDWPSIEQVASTGGPNQTMAKLLLAARAEGANSRWPF